MSLTIHHLRLSQSERIVWLCEELRDSIPGFQFDVVSYDRDQFFAIAPPEFKSLHPAGMAPLVVDGTVSPAVTLFETQAIMEYIIHVHGKGLFEIKPGDPAYPAYLTWYNFGNGSIQPHLTKLGTMNLVFKHLERALEPVFVTSEASNAIEQALTPFEARLGTFLQMIEDQLSSNTYLAGVSFSAADIMMNFSLTTMRGFYPINLQKYPNILRYLNMIYKRPAYRRAMERCNPGLPPLIGAVVGTFDYPVLK